MDVKFDPYVLLGLPRGASSEDVKRVYHRLAQRLHPDKNRMASAARQFQDISLAYNLLSDPIARRQINEDASKNNNHGEDLYFTLRVTPSKRTVIPLDEDQVVYMLAEVSTPPQVSSVPKHEARLNLCLVLDVSNSMKGPRIDRVKVAAQKIIQDLNPQDFISVVTFNDRATIIIPATATEDKTALRARISMISATGGTEIYHGLKAGYDEIRKNISTRVVNHIILLTDGHTFGDQDACLALAREAYEHGVTITAMGLGSDWNDEFLDALSSSTGGTSMYINSTDVVIKYLNEHVRALSNAFAERMELIVAPDPDINLEMAFKLSPNPQPIELNDGIIPLSSLQANRPIAVLLQLQIPGHVAVGFRTFVRLVAAGDILKNRQPAFQAVSDFSIDVNPTPTYEEPPSVIMDALSKLTLYRIQEKARADLEAGRIEEATRRLENLATRLYEIGESTLAQQALSEAQNVAKTRAFSEVGKKTIKYETRALMGQGGLRAALSSLLSSGDDES
jgi:Ca-activated chloride channel family protein